jgi:hypothetical protein
MLKRARGGSPKPAKRTVETVFAQLVRLTPEEQERLWVRLYEIDAPFVQPCKRAIALLLQRAMRA